MSGIRNTPLTNTGSAGAQTAYLRLFIDFHEQFLRKAVPEVQTDLKRFVVIDVAHLNELLHHRYASSPILLFVQWFCDSFSMVPQKCCICIKRPKAKITLLQGSYLYDDLHDSFIWATNAGEGRGISMHMT